MQLFKDFKLYRILVVVIIAIGFGMMLVAMYLRQRVYTSMAIPKTTSCSWQTS